MISIVVPLYNEEAAAPVLISAIREAMASIPNWELVLVDDGSRDDTVGAVQRAIGDVPQIRLVRLARNYGQSTAMQAGFDQARGEVIISMDGDLQNDPRDIPRLLARLEEGFDLVAGYRERRQDTLLTRKLPSWVANQIIRGITGVAIRDNGCSLKAYRREVLDRLRLYSDLHRFIPAQAASTSAARISEISVRHHARVYGSSKYGLSRVPKVAADLLTIYMVRSFRERPFLLFSAAAVLAVGAGALLGAWPLLSLLRASSAQTPSVVLTGAALLFFWLGGYLLMLGLIAAKVLHRQAHRAAAGPPLLHEASCS